MEDQRSEPARTVMTRWGVHNPVRGMDSSGGSAPERVRGNSMDVQRVESYADRVARHAHRVPSTRRARKRLPSESSHSERDDAEVEIQDLRSQLAKERRRN
eukprot:2291432-Amphidinium_carterae.1